ncbi:MAG: LysM peptidoglycan-binding domain-containing protein [Chloroflexi bacterium]|nr:LysM peptidoglycan-binding domain-containing protein [Chloroflexota bacterium]
MVLMLPLAVIVLVLGQLPMNGLAAPTSSVQAESSMAVMGKRPTSSNAGPPPTLAPPTATPRPTATPVPAAAEPNLIPQKGGTYRVQPGDELKQIAATYNMTIWKIIAANDIPDPDSLRIGTELDIPAD